MIAYISNSSSANESNTVGNIISKNNNFQFMYFVSNAFSPLCILSLIKKETLTSIKTPSNPYYHYCLHSLGIEVAFQSNGPFHHRSRHGMSTRFVSPTIHTNFHKLPPQHYLSDRYKNNHLRPYHCDYDFRQIE